MAFGGGGIPFWPTAPRPCPRVHLWCRYTGTTPSPPPGYHYTSPSENMWNTGSTYNLSSGMAVAGERVPVWVGRVAEPLTGHTYQCFRGKAGSSGTSHKTLSPPLTSPSLDTGMPTAYDLSSVIASGSSVGHNNLIPLGECARVWGGGGRITGTQNGPCARAFCIAFSSSLGLLVEVLHSSLPRSAAAATTLPAPWCESVSGSTHLRQNVGLGWPGAVTPSPFLPPSAAQPTRGLSITPTPGWAP